MRKRLAWQRWRTRRDAAAHHSLARQYQHLASPELVSALLAEYRGCPGAFPEHVRRASATLTPVEARPSLATAKVAAAELYRGIAATQGTLLRPTAVPHRPQGPRPAPRPSPPSPDVGEATPPAVMLPVTAPAARHRLISGGQNVMTLPAKKHAQALGVALSAAPQRHYPQYGWVFVRAGNGEVVFFARGEAVAHWYTLPAETQGFASVQVTRTGACRVRDVPGAGPITLEIHEDHLTAWREGGRVTVAARLAAPPPLPERTPVGGVILSRAEVFQVLHESELREVGIARDRGRCRIGGLPVPVAYATGSSFGVTVDRRFFLEAVKRGTDAEVMLEVFGALEPVMVSSGKLVALIAPRYETVAEAGW